MAFDNYVFKRYNQLFMNWVKGGLAMLNEEMVYDLADLFKIFSDSTRLRIMCSLLTGS